MTPHAKKTITVSGLFFLVALSTLIFVVWQITVARGILAEEAALVAQNDAREQASLQLSRTLESSAATRAQLDELFLTEDKTIDFLAELEAIAVAFGIEMKTTSLDLKPLPNQNLETLNIRMNVSGVESQVMRFLELLEVLPYHARIEGTTLTKQDAGTWDGSIQIAITSLAHDK